MSKTAAPGDGVHRTGAAAAAVPNASSGENSASRLIAHLTLDDDQTNSVIGVNCSSSSATSSCADGDREQSESLSHTQGSHLSSRIEANSYEHALSGGDSGAPEGGVVVGNGNHPQYHQGSEQQDNQQHSNTNNNNLNMNMHEDDAAYANANYCQDTIFVGGLSFRITEDELRYFFEGMGEVTHVYIKPNQDPSTGRLRGYGFVTFRDSHIAQKLRSMGEVRFESKRLVIGPVRRPSQGPPLSSSRRGSPFSGTAPQTFAFPPLAVFGANGLPLQPAVVSAVPPAHGGQYNPMAPADASPAAMTLADPNAVLQPAPVPQYYDNVAAYAAQQYQYTQGAMYAAAAAAAAAAGGSGGGHSLPYGQQYHQYGSPGAHVHGNHRGGRGSRNGGPSNYGHSGGNPNSGYGYGHAHSHAHAHTHLHNTGSHRTPSSGSSLPLYYIPPYYYTYAPQQAAHYGYAVAPQMHVNPGVSSAAGTVSVETPAPTVANS
eukprot:ANDGO_02500.mRNA.1 Protein gar2